MPVKKTKGRRKLPTVTKPKPPKTKATKVPKLKEIYGKRAPDYARRQRADILQKMVTEAEEDGLYEKLDVTAEQVRIVELEAEVASLNDLMESMSKVHRKSTKELKQSLRALIAHAEGTRKITSAQLARARWRLRDHDEKP